MDQGVTMKPSEAKKAIWDHLVSKRIPKDQARKEVRRFFDVYGMLEDYPKKYVDDFLKED